MKLGAIIGVGTRSTVHLYGRDLVAKVPLPTTPDSWTRFEAVYTAAVRAVGAPAPRVIETVEIDGRLVGLYQRIVGPSMWEQICAAPETAGDVGVLLGRLHRQVLDIAAPLTVPRQRDRLVGKFRRAAAMVDPELLTATSLIPDGSLGTTLCHGDLHPGNVVMSDEGPVIIDWFDACGGAAIGDIARSSLLMGAGGAAVHSVAHLPGASHQVLTELHDGYLDQVSQNSPPVSVEFDRWLRIAAVARLSEGVAVDELMSIWRTGRGNSAIPGQ